ncbi:SgcJ/EcaC family oxidoreductase [Streptomyces olivochromogenes]|uniref:SgcJ/EcaC family oxidoreductase n=1 Tax=Streptomyces olivochromogenes TaxID=1963 RepID=UPI001F3FE737|nr:SgcJ/EcaC family oxidoreductase [Streptomyces olivochromogenes]MCF3137110.1 SgcJ/EcaC family oxidoreductase [Streptomyces olivochromogenes]
MTAHLNPAIPLDPARAADATAVHTLLERSCAAWANGDGAAYGEQFTTDATDVTYVGTAYHGGTEIGRAHQALFDSFLKGTRLIVEITDLRFYGTDTAVVVTRGDVRKGGPKADDDPAKLGKLATYTVVREADGRWRIAAVQKTQRKPLMEALSFRFQPATRPAKR